MPDKIVTFEKNGILRLSQRTETPSSEARIIISHPQHCFFQLGNNPEHIDNFTKAQRDSGLAYWTKDDSYFDPKFDVFYQIGGTVFPLGSPNIKFNDSRPAIIGSAVGITIFFGAGFVAALHIRRCYKKHRMVIEQQQLEKARRESALTNHLIENEYLVIDWGQLLGRGSFAEVYAALYHGVPVAVKIFNQHNDNIEAAIESARQEISALSVLDHPNIIHFFGVCRIEINSHCKTSTYGIVMERAETSLFNLLYGNKELNLEKQNLSWKIRLKFAYEISCGLDYLHSRLPPIIHGDLKSLNVLITKDGSVRISDFGTAGTKTGTNQEKPGGTPIWTAPELFPILFPTFFPGPRETTSEKTDTYSLGMVFHELLMLNPPLVGIGLLTAMQSLWRSERPMLVVPSEQIFFKNLIERCWAKNPNMRPNIKQIKDILESNLTPDSTRIVISSATASSSNSIPKTKQNDYSNTSELSLQSLHPPSLSCSTPRRVLDDLTHLPPSPLRSIGHFSHSSSSSATPQLTPTSPLRSTVLTQTYGSISNA